jgi:hypothetical protein
MFRISSSTIAAIVVVASLSGAASSQAPTLDTTIGKWLSVEQFEGEPRFAFSFKRTNGEISGWAVLLGQNRKGDHRATLAMTFSGVKWDKDRLRFETPLPEDEGTLGWELRPMSATRATLRTLTINGEPADDDDLVWEMVR